MLNCYVLELPPGPELKLVLVLTCLAGSTGFVSEGHMKSGPIFWIRPLWKGMKQGSSISPRPLAPALGKMQTLTKQSLLLMSTAWHLTSLGCPLPSTAHPRLEKGVVG